MKKEVEKAHKWNWKLQKSEGNCGRKIVACKRLKKRKDSNLKV